MKRTLSLKTMFLTLAAVLGVAIGASALATTAHARVVSEFPPSDAAG